MPRKPQVALPRRAKERLKFLAKADGESAAQFLDRQIAIAWEARDIGCNLAAIDAARQQYIDETGREP